MNDISDLRSYQKQLHTFQVAFAIVGLILMLVGSKILPESVPYVAIGIMFFLARNDYLYHRVNHYLASEQTDIFETWLKKFSSTKIMMPILDLLSFTPIFYLLAHSYNNNFALPNWLTAGLFFTGLLMIPISAEIAERTKIK